MGRRPRIRWASWYDGSCPRRVRSARMRRTRSRSRSAMRTGRRCGGWECGRGERGAAAGGAMIDAVTGILAAKTPTYAVVRTGGLHLHVLISVSCFETLPAVGREITLLSHLHVREDALQLFGFADEVERNLFERLISVSGIGPRLA